MDRDTISKAEWEGVERSLEDIAPFYEKVNLIMTFLQAPRWRSEAAKRCRGKRVLEIGSGPGDFALLLGVEERILLEPSRKLLGISALRIPDAHVVRGVGERIPMTDSSIDSAFCVFSFRDFIDKPGALWEIHRVLRKDGLAIIVDVAKPGRGIRRTLMRIYIKNVIPHLIPLLTPRDARRSWTGRPYLEFARTYDAFGETQHYRRLFQEAGFKEASLKTLSLGGAFMLTGVKS